MEYLTPLDASFLNIEDEEPRSSLAIASIAVIDGPAPSHEAFVTAIRGRLPLVARYRQKVRRLPFDLGRPVWVDEPDFDLRYHLRRTALPVGGGDEELCAVVARIMANRLDRDRPLWECWVIEGLPDGRWAVLSKVHHCMVDGVSGNALYRMLFDASPEPSPPVADAWRPESVPTSWRLLADALGALARTPVDQVRLLARAARTPAAFARRAGDTARGLATLTAALLPVPATSLTGPLGRARRYAVARASMRDIRTVAKGFDVTVNDVFLAAVAGAFRGLLVQRGEQPLSGAVRTLVPVSLRAAADALTLDNRLSLMLALLPVEYADPVNRLLAVHDRVAILKCGKEIEAGAAMTELSTFEPFAPISLGIRMVLRIPQRTVVTVTTNVPGPRELLYAFGRPIREILPYVPIADRMRVGVSVLTYGGQAVFGVTADFATFPQAQGFADAIVDEIAALVRAVPSTPAPAASVGGIAAPATSPARAPAVSGQPPARPTRLRSGRNRISAQTRRVLPATVVGMAAEGSA